MPRAVRERQLLEAAGQVFARRGYHDASMDEIAALADVSKPLLYAHFGSKEGLYLAYVDRSGRELEERLIAASGPSADRERRIRAPITEFLAFVEEHRDAWTVLYASLNSSPSLAEEVATLRRRIARAIRELLGPQRSGETQSDLAYEGVADAIVGAGESLANWWLEHPDVPRDEVADWFVSLVDAAATAAVRARLPATR